MVKVSASGAADPGSISASNMVLFLESWICDFCFSVAARKIVQMRPRDTLACCWDVKQPTNKQSFLRRSHTSDLKIDTQVVTLPGIWHYRVSAETGLPGVIIL